MICCHPSLAQHSTDSQDISFVEIEYRQLVSRSSTQRLHSPSLDHLPRVTTKSLVQWEIDDRKTSRAKAQQQLSVLGVSWSRMAIPSSIHEDCANLSPDRFVQDIESAEQEVHFLTSARHEPSDAVSRRATTLNTQIQYRQSVPSQEWRDMHMAQMQALRIFGRVRVSA
jgi:hypothetical protein